MSEYIKKSSLLQKNFTKRKMCLRNKKLDHQVFEKFCLWYIHIKFVNRGYKKKTLTRIGLTMVFLNSMFNKK